MIRPGDENARSDVESGIYERRYEIQPGDVVLDLGAHIGFFTELAASKVGPSGLVIAFEPHPDNFALLQERVRGASNVLLVDAAVSNLTDTPLVYLRINPGNTGGHSLFECDQQEGRLLVRCVKASSFSERHPVRFVKCDTEGSELEIMMDLLPVLKAPVDIAFETHSADLYDSCKALLLDGGYEFEPMTPHVGVCYAWLKMSSPASGR